MSAVEGAVTEEEAGPVGELLAAVRGGDVTAVPRLLAGLDQVRRRACLPVLKELREQVRDDWSPSGTRVKGALLVAGAGCHTGPAAAVTWLCAGDLGVGTWARHPVLDEVVGARPREWQIEVARRIAARPARSRGWSMHPLAEAVVRRTGCEVPTGEAFVRGWMDGLLDLGGSRPTLGERLRADRLTPALAPRLFDLADLGGLLTWRLSPRPGDVWTEALAELAAAGVLDRTDLVDRCLARLVRGGKPADQRAFLEVLRALGPTPGEYAARVRDVMVLLDGPSVLASHAQGVLAGLDEAGLVEPQVLAEVSAVVLFRTEKKLVRAQLGWLDKAARRAPERCGSVVLAAAEAFGHPDRAVQERALNVVARHLRAAGEAVLPGLLSAADALDPAHHARAGALFGAPVGAGAGEGGSAEGGSPVEDDGDDLLPPAPRPCPLGPPIATAAELAEELAALLADWEPGVAAFERVLDGLVRQTRLDREGLLEALEPVRRTRPWDGGVHRRDCLPRDITYVVAAVAGETPRHGLWTTLTNRRSPLRSGRESVHGAVLAARLEEAARQVDARQDAANPPPYLLATPTDATGALDAAELVGRLRGYEAAGVTPGRADLCAALLRVGPGGAEQLRAAEELTSPSGRWLAHWLRTGGLPAQPSERVLFAPGRGSRRGHHYPERWWEDVQRVAVAQPGAGGEPKGPDGERLAAEFRGLLEPTGPSVSRARGAEEWGRLPVPHWMAMLPWHREEQAARWLDHFAAGADRDERGAGRYLPLLAESGGRAGLALHLALAYGLGARHTEDRTGAVDALLVLAARGDLDGALLGRELGELVARGTVKATRPAAALGLVARTGAYRTAWSVLHAALPALLGPAEPPVRGLGELLALAADCARHTRARGPVAEVTAAADRGGASRVVKEARMLRDVLAG